eukprot:TRINITY_DN11085_c1_g1_i1.p1 TRINITY_DN11085_c1_g1~~TRINITY_DN11085_c1_g1_i1.p1  ORF type:complete len:2987 (+),score=712.08 TRINITY_DN11085_c1_g1_i1:206-9166(+)
MWSGRGMGRSPGGSLGSLECLRKLLFTAHASVPVQKQHIDAVVNALTKDDSQELPESTVQQLNKEMKGLFNGDTAAKMLGMRVIRALIDADYWDFVLKITFFYNLMKSVLPSSDPEVVVLASKVISDIASAGVQRDGGLITASIVEEEVRRALEWLSNTADKYNRWYSACIVLKNLAGSVPELIMARSELFLERIWNPLWSDAKENREAAVECFRAVIDMAFTDDQDWSGLFSKVLSKIFEGLHKCTMSSTHGSLICLRELLHYSEGQLPSEYEALASAVLDGGASEDISIQIATLEVLPRMGRYYESLFGVSYLEETMARVAKLYTASHTNRGTAFWALCELCTILDCSMVESHIPSIVKYIRQGLTTTDMRQHALKLLGILCTTCPLAMEVELSTEEWQDHFRAAPLTENHFEALQSIMTAIPSLRKDLMAINNAIVNHALGQDSSEAEIGQIILALKSIATVECCIPQEHDAACELLQCYVLKYLSHEDFDIRSASIEAAMAIVKQLTRQNEETTPSEQSLCETISHERERSLPRPDMLTHLLEPVVDVAVVDMDPRLRFQVLSLLESSNVIKHLATPSCIDCLFMAVNDTVPENRRLAVLCLCRLSGHKSVLAGLTKISVQLSEDIDTIRDNARQQAHCSELLALLIRHVPTVVLPIAFDILHIIKARLSSSLSSRNPMLVSSLLTTLGELNDLINVEDVAAKSLLIEFLPLVLDCLEDRHNLNKRLAAVHALIKIIRSAGLVIDFYEEYPHVLPVLLGFLQSKEDWGLQSGVMRLIGTIGAVDPLRAKNLSFWAEVEERDGMKKKIRDEAKRKDKCDLHRQLMKSSLRHQIQQVSQWNWGLGANGGLALELPMRSSPQLMEQLPAVALQALLLILANASHSITHPKAIDAIRQVIKSLSREQLIKFCPSLLAPILKLLRTSSRLGRDTHCKLFQLLNTLVVMLNDSMKSHCESILTLLRDYWEQVIKEVVAQRAQMPIQGISGAEAVPNTSNDSAGGSVKDGPSSGDKFGETQHEEKTLEASPSVPVETLLINLISLIEEVNKVHTLDGMMDHSKWILQSLIQSMQIDKMERMELVKKCFDAFKSLAVCMQEHLHVVLPVLLETLSRKELAMQIKIKALTTLHSVLANVPIKEHTARVLHHLLITLRDAFDAGTHPQLTDFGLRCIHVVIKNTDTAFIRFIPLTKKMLGAYLKKDPALEETIEHLETTGRLPSECKKTENTKKPDPRPFKSEETPKILSCVLDKRVEMFNADSFKKTIATHLKISTRCIEVLRTKGPVCTVDFRFIEMDTHSLTRYNETFMNMFKSSNNGAHDPLTYDLRLIEVKEKQITSITMQTSSLKAIWSTRGRRKPRDWEEWINRLSIELLKHAPSQALRACFQVALAYIPIARDLFSYSFVACFLELDEIDKMELISHMNHALRSYLPPSVLHMILTLAEFMEEERYPKRTAVCSVQSQPYKLTRPTTAHKFGVGYTDDHQGGSTKVKVSKIQSMLPGDKANLPIGGIVLKLNGTRVMNVKQLSNLLQGQTVITLDLQPPASASPRHVNKPGPFFDVDLLAEVCEKKQLLAKAFHYKEEQFRKLITEVQDNRRASSTEINKLSLQFIDLCSDLIHLSNNLGLREGANGILDFSKKYFEDWKGDDDETGASFSKLAGKQLDSMLLIEGRGYEKLQWWSQAIKAYKTQAAEADDRNKYVIGIMRCYRQLGRWEHLLYEAKRSWESFQSTEKEEVSSMAAHGAWILSAWSNLGESIPSHWDFMDTCIQYMPKDGDNAAEREFFQAILAVHKERYSEAESHINTTRKLLEGRLSSLVGESYARAYNVIVWLQKVRGLEEVIEYNVGSKIKWPQLREVWHKRMFGMSPTVENWQDMLGIMALVLEKGALTDLDSDDLALWLKFVSICRRCNRNSLAESTLLTLMGFSTRNFRNFLTDDTIDQHLSKAFIDAQELIDRNIVGHVCLSYFKHLYHCDMRSRAVDELRTYVESAVVLRQKSQKLMTEIEQLNDEITIRNEKEKYLRSKVHSIGPRRSASAGELAVPTKELISTREDKAKELEKLDARLNSTDLNDDDLLSKVHLTLGEWCQELHKDNFWENPHREEILRHFGQSVALTKTSSRAWHAWGLLNYRIAFRSDSLAGPDEDAPLTPDQQAKRKETFLEESLLGFFNSLDYLEDESFCVPNLLRILTIWFRYAQQDNIATELHRGIRSMRVSIWIYVLPQLVARVSFPQQKVRSQVEDLLMLLGSEYPHHIVYPLTVCAVHGDTSARRKCAQEILDRLSHGEKETMFTQAKVVSQGLIRTAISWSESWLTNLAALEEAGRVHGRNNPKYGNSAAKKIILELYQAIEESDPTIAEEEFVNVYQQDLETAKRYLMNDDHVAAWKIFKVLCKQFDTAVQKTQHIYLSDVAPDLMAVEGYEVAVPGVNQPTDAKTVLIHTFLNEVNVISSKQKPKVIIMLGDDGQEYKFLLKGHEDLRQDERVMQLFGLINALFQRTDDLYHINIITTPVVPLSDNVGLIGWLERTETLNHMIRGYRQAHNIPHNKEVLFILGLGQLKKIEHFHLLPDKEKKEYLQACVDKTPSDCLRKVFWTRTVTSESWLEYRTHYVRTLAAMSMVGYILGLGDRHLNNIMLTDEGKVVHIDFGDCFEVALNRQVFPEKVPFRLTRLLVSAMEASGWEGTYRHTCESVMRCLRKNRDSLTSLLETFVYDPLINWRLLETVAPEEAEAVQEREAERAHAHRTGEDIEKPDDDGKPEGITAAVFTHRIPDGDVASTHDEEEDDKKKTEAAGVDEMQIPANEETLEEQNGEGREEQQAEDVKQSVQNLNQMSVPRSMAMMKSLKWETGQKDDRAWEEELVNEKAKQVVIRIREKLTGYDFPRSSIGSRNPPSPKVGVSPRHEPADFFEPLASRMMMGSYEGSWVLKGIDDECDVGISVAHRETWWLTQNTQATSSDDSKERCTVAEQVNQLILAATSVENLSQMYYGWAPFC